MFTACYACPQCATNSFDSSTLTPTTLWHQPLQVDAVCMLIVIINNNNTDCNAIGEWVELTMKWVELHLRVPLVQLTHYTVATEVLDKVRSIF